MASEVRKELERVSAETFWDMVECLRGNGITEKELQGILQEVPTDSEGLLSCRKLLRRLQSRASDPGPAGLLSRAFGRCFPGRPSEPVEEKVGHGQGTENAWAHEVCEGLRGAGNGVGEQTLQSGSSNAEVPSWSVSVSFRDEQRSLWTWTTASDSASRWTLRSDPCEGQGSSQDLQGCLLDRVHQEGHIEDCEKPMESGKLQGLDARRGSCDHSDPRTSKSAQVKEYDLADKNGLADFLVNANIQLAPQGGPGMRRISKDALHVIVRNLKGDRFTVDMLEGILQEVVPDRQGLLNCEDLAHCLRRPNPAPEPQEPKRYDLAQKQGLADFLKDADIRLVRADFILKLHREGQRLPRRQEAESAYVESRTALVTHEEVQAWADGEAPEGTQIVSLSHCWESREHCDPYAYQVSKLAQTLAGNEWFFIDYVSLYQFQRFSREQNVSFGRAMQHMHVLYCHDKTSTLRIESLTPEADVIEAERRQDCVMMYHHPSGLVKPVPVTELVKNRTPYTQRGWCAAEREWSSTRTSTNLSREVDAPEGEKGGLAPMVPEIFRLSVAHQLKFTHFDDVETVCRLQAEVYKEKAETCKSLRLVDLGAEALGRALSGLERYPILESLEVVRCDLGPKIPLLLKVVTERQLVQLHLQQSNLSEEGAFQLAQALQTNTTLAALSLARDRIGVAGVKALAEALRTNSVLTDLNLSHVCLGSDAVSTLAEALEHNQTLKQLSLAGIENAEEGAFVLLQALKKSGSATQLDLGDDDLGKGAMAMARYLRVGEGDVAQNVVEFIARHLHVGEETVAQHVVEFLRKLEADTLVKLQEEGSLELDLRDSNRLEKLFAPLCWVLPHLPALRAVDINLQGHGDHFPALAVGLGQQKELEELKLNLARTSLGDAGAQSLAVTLAELQNLKGVNLDLADNCMSVAAAIAVADSMRHRKPLERWHVSLRSICGDLQQKRWSCPEEVTTAFEAVPAYWRELRR